jgi:hypothetical protein
MPTERTLDRFALGARRRLDRFALDLDCFARSTPLPSALEHTVDLDCFTQSTLPPLVPEHTIDLDRFTDAPTVRFTDALDRTLCSTSSFPSPQVIHEELVNYCRIQICDKVPT